MQSRLPALIIVGALLLIFYFAIATAPVAPCPAPSPTPSPTPDVPLPPRPDPKPPRPCPGPGPCPRYEGPVGPEGRMAPDGVEPQADFPEGQWFENIGSKKDGAGMCVFSACEMMFLYHGLEYMRGFRNWCAENYPGGGYPSKLADLVAAYCKAHNCVEPQWWQYEGPIKLGDGRSAFELAGTDLRSGKMLSTTIYYSDNPGYQGRRILHMVNLVHYGPSREGANDKWFAIMDNNFSSKYEWADVTKIVRKLSDDQSGRVWLVGMLSPGPPPVPYRK